MLKLKKNVKELLTANVKPDQINKIINDLADYVEINRGGIYTIRDYQTLFNKDIEFSISILDFERVEDLKPYKWYTKEEWDGNPNKYWLIERSDDEEVYASNDTWEINGLMHEATHFMYIEGPETKETDDANS